MRQKIDGILRVQADFDRVAAETGLRIGDLLASGDRKLERDEVESGRLLGDWMLDLDPPVQLEEVEVAPVEQEFDGSKAPIADLRCERDRPGAHPFAQRTVERGRRRLFQDLLVPPLDRALALAERIDVPTGVGEQLDLDVPGTLEVALEEDGLVAEGGFGLAARRRDAVHEVGRLANDSHPATAAAGRSLDHQRKPDLIGLAGRQHGNACCPGGALRLELVAAATQRYGSGADKDKPCRLDRLGEVGVFGKEPIAGMDRVGARLLRSSNVLLRIEVARDLDGFARRSCMQRALVVRRGDGDRGDSLGRAGAEDAEGDLAAVGYEELPDLHAAWRLSRNARRPSWPSGLVRSLAASCAASSPPGRSRISCFAARVASGPALSSSRTTRSIASSSSCASSWTRPVRRAISASKRSPVRKSRRAAAVPMRGKTNGEITAGTIPSLTSEKPKTASGAAIAMSVQQISPEPPPRA